MSKSQTWYFLHSLHNANTKKNRGRGPLWPLKWLHLQTFVEVSAWKALEHQDGPKKWNSKIPRTWWVAMNSNGVVTNGWAHIVHNRFVAININKIHMSESAFYTFFSEPRAWLEICAVNWWKYGDSCCHMHTSRSLVNVSSPCAHIDMPSVSNPERRTEGLKNCPSWCTKAITSWDG